MIDQLNSRVPHAWTNPNMSPGITLPHRKDILLQATNRYSNPQNDIEG